MSTNPLPEQPISPPSEAWSPLEEARQSKISHLRGHLAETMAALGHIGEAQSSINYMDPERKFITEQDIGQLWMIRKRVGDLRQYLRDELELRGENPDLE